MCTLKLAQKRIIASQRTTVSPQSSFIPCTQRIIKKKVKKRKLPHPHRNPAISKKSATPNKYQKPGLIESRGDFVTLVTRAMKVVYIPIVLPINIRSFWAIGLGTIGLLLLILSLSWGSWLSVTYTNEQAKWEGDIKSVQMVQSLQSVSTTTCYHDPMFPKVPMCGVMQVQYVECDSSEGSLWCEGNTFFVAAFAILVLSIIGTFVSTIVGFFRELWYGPCTLVLGIASAIALILYRFGVSKVTAAGPAYIIRYIARADNGNVSVTPGISLVLGAIGVTSLLIGSLVSISLLVYRVESRTVTEHSPRVQVVKMSVAAGGNIASMAPKPGFVALSRNEFQLNTGDDDDDDLDLIQAQTTQTAPSQIPVQPPPL